MNPLLRRLATLRLKVRLLDGWQGSCALIALVLIVGAAVGLIDYSVHLPTLVRASVLAGLLVGAAGIAYRFLIRPFGKPCDNLNLALRIEEEYPELNDALASTVQFLSMSQEERARLGVSESMRERTVQDTIDRAAKVDFAAILNRRGGVLLGLAALCALALVGWFAVYHRAATRTAALRLVEPFGMHTWTQVAVYRPALEGLDGEAGKWDKNPLSPRDYEPDRIAIGRPYLIKVELEGQLPKQARVEIDGKIRSDMTIAKLTPDGDKAFFVTPINMTQHYQKFKFRVVAGDGSFPPRSGAWHEVEVMHKPKLIDLDDKPSPQITVYPPAYTDLPRPVSLLPGVKHVEVYAGTRVVYRAKADRPLAQAYIRWEPDETALLPLAQAGAGAAVPDKAVANLEGDKSLLSIELLPWASGKYVLYMRDKYGLESEETADIRVVKDPLPVVKLLRPAATGEFAPDAVVPFKFFVTDEKFAVRSVFIEYRRKALDDTPLDNEPTRSVLYEAQTQGKLIPWQIAQALSFMPLSADLRLRPTKLEFNVAWSLKNQKFKEGQIVVVEVCADDYCNIYPKADDLIEGAFREPGRSHTVVLRIVSKRDIIAQAERVMGQVQQELQNASKLEKKALQTVQEIKKQDKITQETKDKLTDNADSPQRDVRDIIGKTPEDGVRGTLNKLRQTLKANGLENTRVYKEAKETQGALDNIGQEELQQIEPKLNEIRNDFNHSDKNDPKTKTKLEETAQMQKSVIKTLDGIIAKMDPGAKMRDQRIELRDIISKEQQIREDLAKLKAEKVDLDQKFPSPEQRKINEERFKEMVRQKAEEQKQLAERVEKLVQEMKTEAKDQERLGNKLEKQKLDQAVKELEQNQDKPKAEPKKQPEPPEQKLPLNSQMNKVAKELRDKSEAPQQALDKQQKIAQDLEKALEKMEGRNPDLAKEEIKDRQDMAKDIDKLNRELKQLREEEKKIDQIKDMQERLKKKEELAQKFGALQEKIEDARRQAARLQEQNAANELKEAAKELEQARQKMEQGDNAQAEEQKAKQHLDEAKNEIKQSEEQLAREMLIKIADQLKGLKERQDASLRRTETLHPKVMKIKSWTDALLDTMEGNIDAQKGIADETDGLQDKLKGAVVFGGILKRAKESMEGAGKIMEKRRDEGKDRRYIADGKKMDDDEWKDEVDWQSDTVRHQKQAARSLTNLLDALKEEIDKPKPPTPVKNDQKDPDKNAKQEQPKGGVPNQDGIPPKAQLKALKAEQLDLNERTADFHTRNPDPAQFTDRQRDELRALEQEQSRLMELFQGLTRPPENEGEQP